MKVEYQVNVFGYCTNLYRVGKGRAKRMCRTNGWEMRATPKGYVAYEIYSKGKFIGHYDSSNNDLYVILENLKAANAIMADLRNLRAAK